MKILLVEDSATLRHATTSYIRAAGHLAVVAESGEEALQLVEREPVDLIIMDVEMPGLNGFETTRLMREWLGEHWIPIIFLTGKNDDASYKEGIEAGGDDYLIKPVSEVILTAKIRAMGRITDMRDQLHKLNAELENLSQRDGLTRLYNRRTFTELSKQQWSIATRNHQPLSLIMLDIDHFKPYNDFYGHPAGDECLRRISKALSDALQRPADIVARYGGEEFIILLPETELHGAKLVGENILLAINQLEIMHERSNTASHVTASIGIASCQHTTGRTLDDMIKQADSMLYHAKNNGRNRVAAQESALFKTILVADDDPDTLLLLKDQLRDHCNIVTAASGQECLDLARAIQPDLLLLDIHMPNMSGLEVCEALKESASTASIPIILISGEERSEQLRLGKKVGANECLQKPLHESLLLAKVNHFLL